MVGIVVVTRAALLIARPASTWTVAEHLNGRSPVCVAVDPGDPTRVYCGTARARPERADSSNRRRGTGQCHSPPRPPHRVPGRSADQWFLGRRHLPAHVQGRTVCASVRLPPADLGGGVPPRPGHVRQFCRLLVARAADHGRHEVPRGLTVGTDQIARLLRP